MPAVSNSLCDVWRAAGPNALPQNLNPVSPDPGRHGRQREHRLLRLRKRGGGNRLRRAGERCDRKREDMRREEGNKANGVGKNVEDNRENRGRGGGKVKRDESR